MNSIQTLKQIGVAIQIYGFYDFLSYYNTFKGYFLILYENPNFLTTREIDKILYRTFPKNQTKK